MSPQDPTPNETTFDVADEESHDYSITISQTLPTPDESTSHLSDGERQDHIISPPTSSTPDESASQLSDNKPTSNIAEEERQGYVIFPADPFKISSIAALLASYPDAEVEDHDSVGGWGMLFWYAALSKVQWQEVTDHEEVGKVYTLPASEGREDPDEEMVWDPDEVRGLGK
ncbi:hypothetical protein PVAG01_11051 [Phlyctema vagabunda]|uniref:Uncharacterized protein n=1 Tax=Phlyctema vagabunda TaxID=108571 RepID=A0ABR4P4M4_9HELO